MGFHSIFFSYGFNLKCMVKLHLFLFGTISCLAGRNLHPENLLQRQLSFVAGLPYYLAVFFTSESPSVSLIWFHFWWEVTFLKL